jgi:hypothetical protein
VEKLKPILGPLIDLEVAREPQGSRTVGGLTVGAMTLARVRNWTVLKVEAELACAVAPARGPQRWALGSPHRAALRERVRWGDLRPELGRELALAL